MIPDKLCFGIIFFKKGVNNRCEDFVTLIFTSFNDAETENILRGILVCALLIFHIILGTKIRQGFSEKQIFLLKNSL